MSELLGILFTNIGIVEMLEKVKGKKENLQSGIMGNMEKGQGQNGHFIKFKKIQEKAMWPCSMGGVCHILINKGNCACAWLKLAREANWSS